MNDLADSLPIPNFDAALHAHLLAKIRAASPRPDSQQQWLLLQAAHVVGQTRLLPHLVTHWLMLTQAWRERDESEMAGQLWRLALVPLGHLIGRLPIGNPGRADVGALRPMPMRPDIAEVIAQAASTIR